MDATTFHYFPISLTDAAIVSDNVPSNLTIMAMFLRVFSAVMAVVASEELFPSRIIIATHKT